MSELAMLHSQQFTKITCSVQGLYLPKLTSHVCQDYNRPFVICNIS